MVHGLETINKLNNEAYTNAKHNKPDTYFLASQLVDIFFNTVSNQPGLAVSFEDLPNKNYKELYRSLLNQVQFKLEEELH